MTTELLQGAPFLAEFTELGYVDRILTCLRDVAHVAPEMHAALTRLRAAGKRAWDIYILGTQTDGASWLTGWQSYDPRFLKLLGVQEGERVAGLIHIGTPKETPSDRPRPVLADITTFLD